MPQLWKSVSSGFALLSFAVLLLTLGCSGGSGSTRARFVNASPDEASLDALLDSKTLAASIAYATASAYVSSTPGSHTLQIEATGTSTPIISPSISLTSGTDTTLVAADFSFSPMVALVLTDDNSAPASGDMKLRILNASPSLGTADVYIVAPGTDIGPLSPTISSLAFEAASSYQSLAAGTYEVFFTAPGGKFTYIDSTPLTFSAGQIRTLLGLDGGRSAVLADVN